MSLVDEVYVGTSRARDLQLPGLKVIGGGLLLDDLLPAALKKYAESGARASVVYIIGGLPDTTCMIKEDPTREGERYQEVVFCELPGEATQRIVNIYNDVDMRLTAAGAIPCFSTIATMSLESWNYHRFTTNHTHYNIHSQHYDDMQHFLNETLDLLNEEIFN